MTASVSTAQTPIKAIIGVVGLDQHEVGAVTVARTLREGGVEVIYVGRFNTPETIVRAAVDEDVDVVGVSCHSWEFLTFASQLADLLAEHSISLVLGGSVLTTQDRDELFAAGVHSVFGPGATRAEILEGVERAAQVHRLARGDSRGRDETPAEAR